MTTVPLSPFQHTLPVYLPARPPRDAAEQASDAGARTRVRGSARWYSTREGETDGGEGGGAFAAIYALLMRSARTGLFGNHIEVVFSHVIGL